MDETKDKVAVVNIRLTSEIIHIIDSYIEKGIYSSRAELIREICRNYVLEERYKNE